MPQVLDWQAGADPSQVVDRAVHALAQGQLVAFPTETVYGIAANAWLAEAVERLVQSKGRPETKPLTVAVAGEDQALRWLPDMGPVARRLARRCWPGPLTLVCAEGAAEGLAGGLPDAVRRHICPNGAIGLRAPDHDAILDVLARLPAPVVLTSANRSGEPEATTAAEVVQSVGERIDLIIADGTSRLGKPSTVVRAQGHTWTIVREGAIDRATLQRLASFMVVFVCTGNTCRSPLAEALFQRRLAERLGCPIAELPLRGFTVLSAGLAAFPGAEAAPEAIEAGRELGVDLSRHTGRVLDAALAHQADLLVVMTRGHAAALMQLFPGLSTHVRLLCPDGADIPDPIGCDQKTYRQCGQQIRDHLEWLMPEVLEQ